MGWSVSAGGPALPFTMTFTTQPSMASSVQDCRRLRNCFQEFPAESSDLGPLPPAPWLLTWLPFLYLLSYIFGNQETLKISTEAEIFIQFSDSKNSGDKIAAVERAAHV
jgi:hypothetical protein